MPKQKLFLVPGWAVNSSVWYTVVERLNQSFELHFHDFPGYGKRRSPHTRQNTHSECDLESLITDAITNSPRGAIWMGWSLGSIVAMEAARKFPEQVSALVLICPTPKFMTSDGWQHGQTEAAMDNLSQRFESDYATALKRFLLLQAGTDSAARANAKSTLAEIAQHPSPSWPTLESGLNLLRQTDLRNTASEISAPTQIIIGRDDRVIPPQAGRSLREQISGSTLLELPTGHSPFIERPDDFSNAVDAFAKKL